VKKNELAPGDSTVVELTFKTRTYKTKLTKSATVHSNDMTNSQVRISVSAKVDPAPDMTLPYNNTPDRLEFTQDDKKSEIIFTNTGNQNLYLTQVGDTYDDLSVKLTDKPIKPGKDTKIKFKWEGEFEKENLERSVTFVVTGSGSTRFTVPFVVGGTDPAPPPGRPVRKKIDRKPAKTTTEEKQDN
jgi:hypothetical protein